MLSNGVQQHSWALNVNEARLDKPDFGKEVCENVTFSTGATERSGTLSYRDVNVPLR